jgi:aspartyl-tRNA(Asn)/glutamyl-tRNA(Gln) amidotransferase subunit B
LITVLTDLFANNFARMSEKYEIIMGLETHVRVKSNTKMWCNCKNAIALESEPNVNICPVCTGMPGMLPVLNAEVINL